jgi:putative addiction module killer protein
MRVIRYASPDGRDAFANWFEDLDAQAAAKVVIAVTRLGLGNHSNAKGVGGGVLELGIDFGPGYRVYFAKDGPDVVVLLGGGTKKRQGRDIEDAHRRWREYRLRRKGDG